MKKLNLSTTKRAWMRSRNFYVFPVILIRRIVIYPVGNAIHLLNSRAWSFLESRAKFLNVQSALTSRKCAVTAWSTFFFPLVLADVHIYLYWGGLRDEPKERLRRRKFPRELWSLVSVQLWLCSDTQPKKKIPFLTLFFSRIYCVFGYKRLTTLCVYRRFIAPSL